MILRGEDRNIGSRVGSGVAVNGRARIIRAGRLSARPVLPNAARPTLEWWPLDPPNNGIAGVFGRSARAA